MQPLVRIRGAEHGLRAGDAVFNQHTAVDDPLALNPWPETPAFAEFAPEKLLTRSHEETDRSIALPGDFVPLCLRVRRAIGY